MNRLTSTALLAVLTLYNNVHAWISTSNLHISSMRTPASLLFSTPDAANPCWQDNYDSEDDCLGTIYSAAFVAEEWIKSMPCGKVRSIWINVQICALLNPASLFRPCSLISRHFYCLANRMRIACPKIYRTRE